MTTIVYDAIADLKSALDLQWNNQNTAGVRPKITPIWDIKSVGYADDGQEQLILTPLDEIIEPFDLYGRAYWHEVPIKVDVRTYSGIDRHNQVVKEASRIIKNIIRRTSTGFLQVVIKDGESFNADYRNMYRHVITLHYMAVDTVTFV